MDTNTIWEGFNEQLYFFILKRVQDKEVANDVFQETFLKIHSRNHQLRDEKKLKAWVYQIARNEIINHYNTKPLSANEPIFESQLTDEQLQAHEQICCFDKFITQLPPNYKTVIELVYLKGMKQQEVAVQLNISLANVKARLRRAKELLKEKFNTCCKYKVNKKGKLTGESNCQQCG